MVLMSHRPVLTTQTALPFAAVVEKKLQKPPVYPSGRPIRQARGLCRLDPIPAYEKRQIVMNSAQMMLACMSWRKAPVTADTFSRQIPQTRCECRLVLTFMNRLPKPT